MLSLVLSYLVQVYSGLRERNALALAIDLMTGGTGDAAIRCFSTFALRSLCIPYRGSASRHRNADRNRTGSKAVPRPCGFCSGCLDPPRRAYAA
jgi:hypothetical protein